MKDIMLADTPIEHRAQILRDSCDQIEERSYTRKFEQNEIDELRKEVSNVLILANNLEEELAGIKSDFKGKIKPLQERIGKILDELKSGGEYVKGECFKFIDAEAGEVGWYSPDGYLLESRAMKPEERQRTTFQTLRRTGTDN